MINLDKSYEFFKPELEKGRVHIIGCGSVGSALAELLARCGITKMTLWDFDEVEAKNVNNQMFTEKHIGMKKTDALKQILTDINSDIEKSVTLKPEGWNGEMLSGTVFLAVDSIKIRKEIVEKHMNHPFVKAVFDIRTGLTDAQGYAADWSNTKLKENLLNSMQYSDEDAKAATPRSACGGELGLVTTVRLICNMQVNNYIRFLKGDGIYKYISIDGFSGMMEVFE